MRLLYFSILTLLSAAACDRAETKSLGAARPKAEAPICANGEGPLPLSSLCQEQAAALLLAPARTAPAAVQGCRWIIRETPFADNLLLYRSLSCDGKAAMLELQVGNHESDLIYVDAPGTPVLDADGQPLVLAKIFAGNPGGRARALWETRDSVEDKQAASRCDLKPPYREGYPPDALIVDVVRNKADLQREDAMPKCGPFGYHPTAEAFNFWRTHQGYAWFMQLGTDVWSIDPASLTLIHRDRTRKWVKVDSQP